MKEKVDFQVNFFALIGCWRRGKIVTLYTAYHFVQDDSLSVILSLSCEESYRLEG